MVQTSPSPSPSLSPARRPSPSPVTSRQHRLASERQGDQLRDSRADSRADSRKKDFGARVGITRYSRVLALLCLYPSTSHPVLHVSLVLGLHENRVVPKTSPLLRGRLLHWRTYTTYLLLLFLVLLVELVTSPPSSIIIFIIFIIFWDMRCTCALQLHHQPLTDGDNS